MKLLDPFVTNGWETINSAKVAGDVDRIEVELATKELSLKCPTR